MAMLRLESVGIEALSVLCLRTWKQGTFEPLGFRA